MPKAYTQTCQMIYLNLDFFILLRSGHTISAQNVGMTNSPPGSQGLDWPVPYRQIEQSVQQQLSVDLI